MKELSAQLHNQYSHFQDIWLPWISFMVPGDFEEFFVCFTGMFAIASRLGWLFPGLSKGRSSSGQKNAH